MLYDSKGLISDKADIFARHDFLEVIRITPARPLFMATLYMNYLLTAMEPYSFRLVNVMFLAAAGVALALMILFILEIPGCSPKTTHRQKSVISFFAALLFVVHPLQTFAVLYIWQRSAIMGCFFYFSAVAVYVGARSGRFGGAAPVYVVTSILLFAGLMSKENLGTLPVVLVLVELILFRQNLRQVMRRAIVIALISVPPAVAYSILIGNLYGSAAVYAPGFFAQLHANYVESGLTPLQVGLSECRVLFSSLITIMVPFVAWPQLIKAEIISRSLLEPPTTSVALAGVIGLLATSVALIRKSPLTAFGILFFLVTFALESLAVAQFLFFGYRAILPMAGVLLILAQALAAVTAHCHGKIPRKYLKPVVSVAALVPLIGLAAITWSQSRTWNPTRFWERAFEELPPFSGNVQLAPYVTVLMSYGRQVVDAGRYGEGIKILARAVRRGCDPAQPDRPPMPDLRVTGRSRVPLADIKSIPAPCPGMTPVYHSAYYELGVAMLKLGADKEAIRMFRCALALRPDLAAATNGLGEAFLRQGDTQEAVRLFRKAIEMQPGCAAAINNLGNVMLGTGKVSEAIDLYRKGIAVAADSPELHNNLGAALMRQGEVSPARQEFRKAVTMNPQFAKARVNLAIASLKMHAIPEALANLNAAIEINPDLARLRPRQHSNIRASCEGRGNPTGSLASPLSSCPNHGPDEPNLVRDRPDESPSAQSQRLPGSPRPGVSVPRDFSV